ncbi:iron-containing redox enzyme family protein [Brevibacillus gelatini]
MSRIYVQKPKLREGCEVIYKNDYLIITYRGDQFELYPQEESSCDEIATLLNLLDGTKTIEELVTLNQAKGFMNTLKLIEVLDENCLLREGKKVEIKGKTGLEFIMDLEDLHRIWERSLGETTLSKLFYKGEAPLEMVIGWGFEYYHITKRAHDCITPAIAKAHGALREQMLEFFHEEYRHDKLLLKSLTSLGYSEQEIINSIPHAYTAAISNALAKWAHTDLLTFMAVLFIMEGTNLDGQEYMDTLALYDLPDDFIRYQGVHSDINIQGDHGNVTRDFFALVDYISPEEQLRVKKNILMFEQLRIRQEETFWESFQKEKNEIPRLLLNTNQAI